MTWILSPGGVVDVPLSLGLQAARIEYMGSRNQRTLQSWVCKLFTALAQLLKAGTPAAPSAVLALIRQVIGPRAEVVGRTYLFEVIFAQATIGSVAPGFGRVPSNSIKILYVPS